MDTVDLKLAQDCEALAVAASEGVGWLKGAAAQSPTVAQQAPSLIGELQKVRNQSRKLARAARRRRHFSGQRNFRDTASGHRKVPRCVSGQLFLDEAITSRLCSHGAAASWRALESSRRRQQDRLSSLGAAAN